MNRILKKARKINQILIDSQLSTHLSVRIGLLRPVSVPLQVIKIRVCFQNDTEFRQIAQLLYGVRITTAEIA